MWKWLAYVWNIYISLDRKISIITNTINCPCVIKTSEFLPLLLFCSFHFSSSARSSRKSNHKSCSVWPKSTFYVLISMRYTTISLNLMNREETLIAWLPLFHNGARCDDVTAVQIRLIYLHIAHACMLVFISRGTNTTSNY